jgi:hypothetical protein
LIAINLDARRESPLVTDKIKMPADGGGVAKGKPDGVSGSPDSVERGRAHGRSSGGESGGGAYPNPHSDKGATSSTFSGGQGEKAYYGGNNPNATTPRKAPEKEELSAEDSDSNVRKSHSVQVGGRTIEVIEDSGVAAAEATGKVGTDAPYEAEQKSPGGG